MADAAPPPNRKRRRERNGASASARSDAPSLEGGLQAGGVVFGAAGAAQASQAAAVAASGNGGRSPQSHATTAANCLPGVWHGYMPPACLYTLSGSLAADFFCWAALGARGRRDWLPAWDRRAAARNVRHCSRDGTASRRKDWRNPAMAAQSVEEFGAAAV